jgi:hypothetical protein
MNSIFVTSRRDSDPNYQTMCQSRPVLIRAASLDHLVGAREQDRRDIEAQSLRRDQVHDEIEFGRLLDRDVRRLRTSQNFVDIIGGAQSPGFAPLRMRGT